MTINLNMILNTKSASWETCSTSWRRDSEPLNLPIQVRFRFIRYYCYYKVGVHTFVGADLGQCLVLPHQVASWQDHSFRMKFGAQILELIFWHQPAIKKKTWDTSITKSVNVLSHKHSTNCKCSFRIVCPSTSSIGQLWHVSAPQTTNLRPSRNWVCFDPMQQYIQIEAQ